MIKGLVRSSIKQYGVWQFRKMCPVFANARSIENDVAVIEGDAQARSGALKQREALTLHNAMFYSRKAMIYTGKAMTHATA